MLESTIVQFDRAETVVVSIFYSGAVPLFAQIRKQHFPTFIFLSSIHLCIWSIWIGVSAFDHFGIGLVFEHLAFEHLDRHLFVHLTFEQPHTHSTTTTKVHVQNLNICVFGAFGLVFEHLTI